MNLTLLSAAMLVAITIVGVLGLRQFSDKVRITFDLSCFLAISFYFHKQGIFFPVFPPLQAPADSGALWLRAIGGAWWLLGSRIIVAALWFALHRDRRSRGARLFSDLFAAAIYVATAAIVLNSVFALPVTGVVATSGVVAIVLGLALQNTLADVFSGIAVGIEAPFGVGDRIQIADKIEGIVVQVNWRSIRIHTDGDDMAIIPNSLIAKAEIINRSIPSPRRAASVELSCPGSAVPDRVIETLLHATLLCPDILQTPAPSAVLTQLGARRNAYKISFIVGDTSLLGSTKDLLLQSVRRQLHYAGFLDQSRREEPSKLNLSEEALTTRSLLRDVILFECLDEQQLDSLAALLELLRLEPGEALFSEGAIDAALYVVAWGILELTQQSGASAETLGCIGAGEYVGEIAMFTEAPHAATAVARTHCKVYRLPRNAIEPLLAKHTEFTADLDKSVRRGMEALHRKIAVLASPDMGPAEQFLQSIRSLLHFNSD
ncbi:mechanosensitive ion channel [Trinickia violacea]|uniref:Small-conductance mechanosensitive channel n=1 Tax=Trinickia violacea TaxID=2571746 RepID=A0A4P8ISH7_9BURK|nr:mechanosensitive ion channel family protein [Trinickia violacea]QCP48869.1 mechanosensitive ion channel [Trinickia violacea]